MVERGVSEGPILELNRKMSVCNARANNRVLSIAIEKKLCLVQLLQDIYPAGRYTSTVCIIGTTYRGQIFIARGSPLGQRLEFVALYLLSGQDV